MGSSSSRCRPPIASLAGYRTWQASVGLAVPEPSSARHHEDVHMDAKLLRVAWMLTVGGFVLSAPDDRYEPSAEHR